MAQAFAEIAFTKTVRNVQNQQGSAKAYTKFLSDQSVGGYAFTERETAFIAEQDGFYQATISETGWPYVQYRGGPKGFLRVLNETSLAYADYRGNRQYLSVGNLTGNNRISLILLDYRRRQRLKIWGEVTVIAGNEHYSELIQQLHSSDYRAHPERIIKIDLKAFDWNCPQHIPQRLTAEEWQQAD